MRVGLWIGGMAIALGCGCGVKSQDHGVREIQFPDPWLKSAEPSLVLMLPGAYQVRRDTRAEGTQDLLFGFQSADGSMSVNTYAVSVTGRAAVGAADRVRWDRAQPGVQSRRQVTPGPAGEIEWKGRPFATPGRVIGRALLSPDEQRLAVISYVATARSSPGIGSAIGGGEPSAGELYLDVFSTRDGARLATTRTSWKGFGPTVLFDAAAWIASDVFIVPVDTLAQRSLLVVLTGG